MHEMHRARMRQKLQMQPDMLADHEILEILLFYSLPRVNTNGIAHELLTAFGSLDRVFSASPSALTCVKGVGESTALYLTAIGEAMRRCDKKEVLPKFFNFNEVRDPLIKSFSGLRDEVFVAYFLDSKQRIIGKKVVCDHSPYKVTVNFAELTECVVTLKPTFVALAHNHLSGECLPSPEDDEATIQIDQLLKIYGVNLVEHIIVTDSDAYSYCFERRLAAIKDGKPLDKI